MKNFLMSAVVAVLTLFVTGCGEPSPADRAAKDMQTAAAALRKTAESTGREMQRHLDVLQKNLEDEKSSAGVVKWQTPGT